MLGSTQGPHRELQRLNLFTVGVPTTKAQSNQENCPWLAQVTHIKEFQNYRPAGAAGTFSHLEHSQSGAADARHLAQPLSSGSLSQQGDLAWF